jgi:hypothetical protein
MKTPKKLPLADSETPVPHENEITPNVTDRTASTEDPNPSNTTVPGSTGSISVRN